MSFLYFLESIRNPICDAFFSMVTLFGDETLFIVFGFIFFWCVSKYQGYFLLCMGFAGTIINQFLKMVFRVPRPWIKDPNFTIVESARDAATGYSFPSGHTQISVGFFGGVARANKLRWLRIASIVMCVLVPLSRMYLGVHTPHDIIVSTCVALILIFGGYPLFKKAESSPKLMYSILVSLAVLMAAYLIFINVYQFPADVYTEENIHNLISARETGFSLMGCALGFILIYTADLKWIKFETKAVWWVQIIKVVVGLAIVLAVKELAKIPLNAILPEDSWARLVRYFLVAVVGGIFWPATFKYLNKLGEKKKA